MEAARTQASQHHHDMTNDNAPWWIKELRIYGISAFVALAAGWGLWRVYENSREDGKDQAKALTVLVEKGQGSIDKNTEAFYKVSSALNQLDYTIQEVRDRNNLPAKTPKPRVP